MDVDHRAAAADAAERHLEHCWRVYHSNQEGGQERSPATEPFDGCPTCEVREVLAAAWPHLKQAALQEAGINP